jgi:hypothetical protein
MDWCGHWKVSGYCIDGHSSIKTGNVDFGHFGINIAKLIALELASIPSINA